MRNKRDSSYAYPLDLAVYPDTFHDTTSLRFEVPEAGRVRLELVDLNGRLVKVLADEPLEAGRHELVVDTNDMPSGAYFARIHSRALSRTVKLLLIR